ncbi:dnaJ-like subfamily C member 25-like [Achlya hypogyna]|uniref:DnaJ-like subfamily C member 25-like n=1 Tax=Achlya hypogyna TaxID=1202772 RepID=A0A1V9Z6K8_ACHHY|nr:dnaJ-like subfamily C member 25-like [Achlya hypogyna]
MKGPVVVLDAANIATLTRGTVRVQRLVSALDHFEALGVRVIAFAPGYWIRSKAPTPRTRPLSTVETEMDQRTEMALVQALVDQERVVLTPPQAHDDFFLIDYAMKHDGFIVSNDMFRDHVAKKMQFHGRNLTEAWIRSRCITFTFVGTEFLPNAEHMQRLGAKDTKSKTRPKAACSTPLEGASNNRATATAARLAQLQIDTTPRPSEPEDEDSDIASGPRASSQTMRGKSRAASTHEPCTKVNNAFKALEEDTSSSSAGEDEASKSSVVIPLPGNVPPVNSLVNDWLQLQRMIAMSQQDDSSQSTTSSSSTPVTGPQKLSRRARKKLLRERLEAQVNDASTAPPKNISPIQYVSPECRPGTNGQNILRMRLLGVWAAVAAVVDARNMYCGERECYDILGLGDDTGASPAVIRRQYRSLSLLVHPDKNPGADAAAQFQDLATAYEVLSQPEKRAAYDHYMLHPEDYAYNYGMYVQHAYAPKSDYRVILLGFVLFLSGCQYLAQSHRHAQAMAYFRQVTALSSEELTRTAQSDTVKRQAAAIQTERNAGVKRGKDRKAKDAAKAEFETIVDELMATTEISGGYEKPALRNLLLVRLVLLPYTLSAYVAWLGHWLFAYSFLRRPYAPDAARYLTCKALGITEGYFFSDQFPHDRDDVLSRELWVPANLADFHKQLEDDWKRKHPTKYKQILRHRRRAEDES